MIKKTSLPLLVTLMLLVNSLPAQLVDRPTDSPPRARNADSQPAAQLSQPANATKDASRGSQPVKNSPIIRHVRRAIERGVEYLKSTQKEDGSWSFTGRNRDISQGSTALATLALLKAGVPLDDPAVVSAFGYLRAHETQFIYALSLETRVWLTAGREDVRVRANIARLIEGQVKQGPSTGSWGYRVADGRGSRGDNSNMWFAVNALTLAHETEFAVVPEVWKRLVTYLKETQHAGGGWGYVPGASQPTGSMTCGALGSLLRAARISEADDDDIRSAQKTAMKWLAASFQAARNPGGGPWHHYWLMTVKYAVQIQNQRLIGDHNWYREGVQFLCQQQGIKDGSWMGNGTSPEIATSMALLFLCPLDEPALSDQTPDGSAKATPNPDPPPAAQPVTVIGKVVATKKSKSGRRLVELSIGRDDGVTPNTVMHVFRTGTPDVSLGKVRVAIVTPEKCVGFLSELENDAVIGIGDRVRFELSPPGKVQKNRPSPVNGIVLATKKRDPARHFVEISIGSDDGLKTGTRVCVFREMDKRKVYLGEIRIELLTPDRSVGVVALRTKAEVIHQKDQVTTNLDLQPTAVLLDGDSILDSLD